MRLASCKLKLLFILQIISCKDNDRIIKGTEEYYQINNTVSYLILALLSYLCFFPIKNN